MPEKVTTEYDKKTGNLIILDKSGNKLAEIHATIQHF